jgi:HAMP domain-containing protein
MTDIVTHGLAVAIGASAMWIAVRPSLEKLARLTDRDERGRFVRRER